jgi:hypothetical protein
LQHAADAEKYGYKIDAESEEAFGKQEDGLVYDDVSRNCVVSSLVVVRI